MHTTIQIAQSNWDIYFVTMTFSKIRNNKKVTQCNFIILVNIPQPPFLSGYYISAGNGVIMFHYTNKHLLFFEEESLVYFCALDFFPII